MAQPANKTPMTPAETNALKQEIMQTVEKTLSGAPMSRNDALMAVGDALENLGGGEPGEKMMGGLTEGKGIDLEDLKDQGADESTEGPNA